MLFDYYRIHVHTLTMYVFDYTITFPSMTQVTTIQGL